MQLQVSDGITTVVLSGTAPVVGCTYFPDAPTRRHEKYDDVTETAEVILRGTEANIRATVNELERLLEQAKRQPKSFERRVYVQYRPVATDALWRSEILEGRLSWSTDPALRRLKDTNPTVRVAVFWRRRFFWEGAETELQLSTSNQSAATGGRTIRNHDDSGTGDDNWVQIAASQVGGVLPAPARVVLTNTTGSAQTYTKLWMAVNAFSDPANFVHVVEAESRSGGIGTVTSDANCSNGSRLDVSLAAAAFGVINFWISAAQVQRTQGRRFRLLARFAANTGTPTITPRLVDDTGNVLLWSGESVIISTQGQHIADLGTVTLPVGGWGVDYGGVGLSLGCRGAMNAQLDFVQLTPLDSYRYVELFGYAVANNAALVDDGIEERTYMLAGGVAYPYAAPRGAPLLLYPNMTQRIIFLHQTSTAAPIANAFSVRVYYRPRRLTL